MTRFVSMMWDEDVRDVEAGLAVHVVQDLILDLYRHHWPLGLVDPPVGLRAFGTWRLRGAPEGSPYWGTQWYVDQSYEPAVDKIVASRWLQLVQQEPWQQSDAHYDIALVAEDLIASDEAVAEDPDGFVLEAAIPGLAAVVSMHRLRNVLGFQEWQGTMRRLMHHAFGQVLGLPGGRYAGQSAPGPCSHLCVMRPAGDEDDLLRLALEEERAEVTFCPECEERLRGIIIGHHFDMA